MKKTAMICACGSGEQFYNCCGNNKKIMIEQHWASIKNHLVQSFFTEHPTNTEQKLMVEWIGQQHIQQFETYLDDVTAKHLLEEAYFFTYCKEKWGQHLIQSMKLIRQPKTREVFTGWQEPTFFIGKILERANNEVLVEHIWTKEKINLLDFHIEKEHIGEFMFGHIVQGIEAANFHLLSSAILISRDQSHLFGDWYTLFQNAPQTTYSEFFANNCVDCFMVMLNNMGEMNDPVEVDLQNLQLIVMLETWLIDFDQKSDELSMIFFNYLMSEGVSKRMQTKESLVGAVIDFGIRYHFIPKIITVKKLAEMCQVSSNTITRYSKKIALYYEQQFDQKLFKRIEKKQYRISSDATLEEFQTWELLHHLKYEPFMSEFDKKRAQKKYKGIPFEPTSKEETAQKYVYEAYITDDLEKRYKLADLAFSIDFKNIDAQLILVELLEESEMIQAYDNIVAQAKQCFNNRVQNIWSHLPNRFYLRALFKRAICYFDLNDFQHAEQELQKLLLLDSADHQQARYLYVATLIYDQKFEIAEKYLRAINGESLPIVMWLRYTVAFMNNKQEADLLFEKAAISNPFVSKYIELELPPFYYPTYTKYMHGDPNEAKWIYSLIYPILFRSSIE